MCREWGSDGVECELAATDALRVASPLPQSTPSASRHLASAGVSVAAVSVPARSTFVRVGVGVAACARVIA